MGMIEQIAKERKMRMIAKARKNAGLKRKFSPEIAGIEGIELIDFDRDELNNLCDRFENRKQAWY